MYVCNLQTPHGSLGIHPGAGTSIQGDHMVVYGVGEAILGGLGLESLCFNELVCALAHSLASELQESNQPLGTQKACLTANRMAMWHWH